jgi:putative ABC transport system ATP-binding protein
MTLLETNAVSVIRTGALPLRFPSLSIGRGEKTLFLGPSGSGKTTFLSVIAGLLRPAEGTVSFEGQDFYALSARNRDRLRGRRFGFVFQTLHLLPALTLRQNIALAADMAGLETDEARLDDLLSALGLADKAHRKPEALSQGEQQRAAIARAVLNRPAIILADEPTSALDDTNAEAVMSLLNAQAEETGAALVVATHDHRIIHHFKTIIRLGDRLREAA